MIEFAKWYLSVAASLYLIATVANFKMLLRAPVDEIIRGVIGCLCWPIVFYFYVKDSEADFR